MNTYKKPEVSEEHLKSMAGYYGTIGEMSIDDFKKEIAIDNIKLGKLGYSLHLMRSTVKFNKLLEKREGDKIDVGEYGLTMYISGSEMLFKTRDDNEIKDITKYLAQNNIKSHEFKELVFNALYINLKTPFCVKLGITTDKTRELTTGVLEATSSTNPDKIESVEELREKKNREIFKNVLRRKGYSDEVIDDIDRVSIFLNNDGLDFLKKHGNQSAAAFTELYPRNIELSLEDFLKIFDLREVSDYFIRPLKFGKDIYINVVDFPVGDEEVEESASGVSSNTNPDKIESVEELREKENREILSRIIEKNLPIKTKFRSINDIINAIDEVTFVLSEEGKKFCRESLELVTLALYNSPITLDFKTFLQKFDFNKNFDYMGDSIKFTFTHSKDKMFIDTIDFHNNKTKKPS